MTNVAKTRLYKTWQDNRDKCHRPKKQGYHNYGAKGISFCEEWQSFDGFRDWALENGYTDEKYLIRLDIEADFSPENCRFVTKEEKKAFGVTAGVKKDIVGKRFGSLVVLDDFIKIPNGTKWKCKCDCGREVYVYKGKLTTGHTNSCGCSNSTLGGLSKTRLYKTWWGIKERCYSPKHASYHNYGAKCIELCEEWQDFMVFYNWAMENGYTDEMSIDRLDSSKNYEPGNCQWISLGENIAKANKAHQRRKVEFTYYGISPEGIRYEFVNAAAFAREYGLAAEQIRRVARGQRCSYKGWKFGYTENKNV